MLDDLAKIPIQRVDYRQPIQVQCDTPTFDVVRRMQAEGHTAVIVEDGSGALVGVFTESDLRQRVDHKNGAWREQPVANFMTREPTTIGVGAPISEALHKMRDGGFRHLPMVDDAGEKLGIISTHAVLSYMIEYFPKEFVNLPPSPRA